MLQDRCDGIIIYDVLTRYIEPRNCMVDNGVEATKNGIDLGVATPTHQSRFLFYPGNG